MSSPTRVRDAQMVGLELALYLESHYGGSLDIGDVMTALASAVAVMVVDRGLRPSSTVDDVVMPFAEMVRRLVNAQLKDPPTLSLREVLDAYKAEKAGKPWIH